MVTRELKGALVLWYLGVLDVTDLIIDEMGLAPARAVFGSELAAKASAGPRTVSSLIPYPRAGGDSTQERPGPTHSFPFPYPRPARQLTWPLLPASCFSYFNTTYIHSFRRGRQGTG